MSLTATFSTANAFVVGDAKSPTLASPNYEVRIAIRDYGQINLSLTPVQFNALPSNSLTQAELGYPLEDYMSIGVITGNFTRVRKTPTSAPSLQFNFDGFVPTY